MNRYLPVIPVLGIVTTITFSANPLLALEPSEIAVKTKEFTVRIEGEGTSGTGTIVEQDGDTYTVLTNWHVVEVSASFEVITVDNQSYQVTNFERLDGVDLAIVQFESKISYDIAEIGNSETITEGASGYVVGYPDPLPNLVDRAYTFQNTNIISKQPKGKDGYQIVHSNPTTAGNSGGGILDENGLLVGINGRTTSEDTGKGQVGLAIPIEFYLAPAYYRWGNEYFEQGEYDKAIDEFSEAIDLDSEYIDALLARGKSKKINQNKEQTSICNKKEYSNFTEFAFLNRQAYFLFKEYQRAIDDFGEVIRLDSNNYDAYENRGDIYVKITECSPEIININQEYVSSKIVTNYTEVIRLNPKSTIAYNNRGNAYEDLEEYKRAIADYTEAIRIDPEYAYAYNNRGNAYEDLKEYKKAIADYTEAIRIDPEYARAYNNRGSSHKELKQYQKAIADYTEVIRLDSEYASAYTYNNRGESYISLREYEKALDDLNKAIDLYREYAEAYYNRGITYQNLNNKSQAIEDFQQAADLYQQEEKTKDYQDAIGRIQQLQS